MPARQEARGMKRVLIALLPVVVAANTAAETRSPGSMPATGRKPEA